MYTRTARGLPRLPNLCPACERFYRARIGRPGDPVGGLRAFAALQLLDAPAGMPPAREEDLALVEDAGRMFGGAPLPPSPDEHLFSGG